MQMQYFKNKSDLRYINKTITPVGNPITQLYLKDKTELLNPVIILDDFPQDVNYCHLSEFDRFYYLTNVEFIEGQFYTSWHVDVLMSFKDDIMKNKALVQRNTNDYDLYMQDNEFKLEQLTNDRYLKFSTTPFSINRESFIMGVLGS